MAGTPAAQVGAFVNHTKQPLQRRHQILSNTPCGFCGKWIEDEWLDWQPCSLLPDAKTCILVHSFAVPILDRPLTLQLTRQRGNYWFFFVAAVHFSFSLTRFSCEFVVAERSTGLPVNLSLPSVPFGLPVNFSLPAVWFQALLVFAALHPWDQVFDLLSSCRPWLRQQCLVWGSPRQKHHVQSFREIS